MNKNILLFGFKVLKIGILAKLNECNRTYTLYMAGSRGVLIIVEFCKGSYEIYTNYHSLRKAYRYDEDAIEEVDTYYAEEVKAAVLKECRSKRRKYPDGTRDEMIDMPLDELLKIIEKHKIV